MKKILLILIALISVLTSNAQNYDDVVVIINENSAASIEIGEYFAQQRNIPDNNRLYIATTVDETIDSLTFVDMKNQIKSAMRAQGLDGDDINYLVTTKGMPFNLEIGDCDAVSDLLNQNPDKIFTDCSCVESDLQLIFHPDSSKMASGGSYTNPYFEASGNFSHAQYDTYLVTRLDGYTVDEVKAMIDVSGPDVPNNLNQFPAFILDISYCDQPQMVQAIYDEKIKPAAEYLESIGCNVIVDTLTEMPFIYGPVMSYVTWNFDPFDKEFGCYLLPGSIVDISLQPQIPTFYDSLNIYNEMLIADAIHAGTSAASTHLHPHFLVASKNWDDFFQAYLPVNNPAEYNLAESFYQSVSRLSWMDLLVGDPKTNFQSVSTGTTEYFLPKVVTWLSDPNTLMVKNAMPFTSGSKWIIYNAQGQAVRDGITTGDQKQFNTNVSGLDSGIYIIHIEDIENRGAVGKFIINAI